MGGIVLHAKKGRIVCSNTIDERLQLVYQEAIPQIRSMLFPCFKKERKVADNKKSDEEEGLDPNVKHPHNRH